MAKITWADKETAKASTKPVNQKLTAAEANVLKNVINANSTLQGVTTDAGDNVTSNAIQFTSIENVNDELFSLVIGRSGAGGIISNFNATDNSTLSLVDGGFRFLIGNGVDNTTTSGFDINEVGSFPRAEVHGNLTIANGIGESDAATLSQTRKSFFITTTNDATPLLIDSRLIGQQLLKVEGFDAFFYEGTDFSKPTGDDHPTFNTSTLLAGSSYLVTIY